MKSVCSSSRHSHPGVIDLPLRQIVENAGEDTAVVLNAVKASKGAYGYNAGIGEYGDMLEEASSIRPKSRARRSGR